MVILVIVLSLIICPAKFNYAGWNCSLSEDDLNPAESSQVRLE